MSNTVIHAASLGKYYNGRWAICDIDLSLAKGEVHALVGANGSGKSTLLKTLLGLEEPDEGYSSLLGENSIRLSRAIKNKIAFVSDENGLPQWMTIDQLIAFQRCAYSSWDDSLIQRGIHKLQLDLSQKISSLSKGQRALVNICIALAQKPDVAILDEPTLGIDISAKQEVLEHVLFSLNDDATVVYCSHDVDEIERLATNLIMMDGGRVVNFGSVDNFQNRFQSMLVKYSGNEPVHSEVPGVVSYEEINGTYHYLVVDALSTAPQFIKSYSPEIYEQGGAGLRRAVKLCFSENYSGGDLGSRYILGGNA